MPREDDDCIIMRTKTAIIGRTDDNELVYVISEVAQPECGCRICGNGSATMPLRIDYCEAHNTCSIADALGAKTICQVPDVGGGAFGAARLSQVVNELRESEELSDYMRIPEDGVPCDYIEHLESTNCQIWKCPACGEKWRSPVQAMCPCKLKSGDVEGS